MGAPHPAILAPTEMPQNQRPPSSKWEMVRSHPCYSRSEKPHAGGHALTDHVVGNVDLDLSLVLEGHLALDTLVRLFLYERTRRRSQVDRKPGPQQPDSRCPRVVWPLPSTQSTLFLPPSNSSLIRSQATFQGAAPPQKLG